ncbi:MAG: 30S ribosomal protein S16 [uncultured bacterium]|nr:MAG: 30S ribosomal protein S16 [uncultured bacterium]
MVVIRLSRGGTKKRPFYGVVAANSRAARDGKYLERLGYFNPIATGGEKRLELNRERIKHWMDIGAQPSERVVHLLCELDNPGLIEKRKVKNDSRKLRAKEKAQAATAEAAA